MVQLAADTIQGVASRLPDPALATSFLAWSRVQAATTISIACAVARSPGRLLTSRNAGNRVGGAFPASEPSPAR